MKIDGTPFRSIWQAADGTVQVIDQRWLPHELRIVPLRNRADFAAAIRDMWVRGAPLIGATAAWGMAMEMARDPSDSALALAHAELNATRPTAINLRWALDRMRDALLPLAPAARADAAAILAAEICDEDVGINRRIGEHGAQVLRDIAARKGAGECADPLQRGLAGDGGLGHRDLSDLSGA
jgi:methylthioribose-1-phosphate isomerase